MIITRARHEEIVRVNILGADGRLLRAAGHGSGREAAQQNQSDALTPFHARGEN